ncbi:MAG TPA: M15 family metallopeptidase [Caulobacteraceae bacterium]|nr:M15 family metallopeptidase [Caulobacteraceae bacterium]
MRILSALAAALLLAAPQSPGMAAPASPAPAASAVALPAAPPARLVRLVGEYGPPGEQLVVYESAGALHAHGRGLERARLVPSGRGRYTVDGVALRFEGGRLARAVAVDGLRLARRDLGDEVQARIRAAVKADPTRLRAAALAATPPIEPAPARPHDLVDLSTVDPGIRFDIRYAGTNNFMGVVLYERAGAYLQRPAAEAVGRVQRSLARQGYGLLVHDGYRPWFVTWMFWKATPDEYHHFVADPSKGSRHNRGSAVDLTLYDLKTGKVVEMPGRYDELSPRSKPDFIGGTSRQRWLRDLLRREMEAEGFTVYEEEWWHFDHKDWRQYGIGTQTFTQLAAAGR